MTVTQIASELVQDVNVDSLSPITSLSEDNLHRVFGGSVSDQVLLLFKNTINPDKLQKIEEIVMEAAEINRKDQLKY